MPGVTITSTTRLGPSGPTINPSATYYVTGITERGPVDQAVRVNGLAEYVEVFGERYSGGFVFDDLQMFFEEGGGDAVVARVVGPAATLAKADLLDRAATTPVNTLRVEAASPGAWGARISARITGTGTDFTLVILFDGVPVETYAGLSSPAAAVTAAAASTYVKVTSLGSATAAPNNSPAEGTFTLTGGTDDRLAVTSQMLVDAVAARHDARFGPGGLMGIPGYSASAVGAGLQAAAVALSRQYVTSAGVGASADTARSQRQALSSLVGAEYGMLVWPAVTLPDSRTVTPEGYVAAARARAIGADGGPWRAGAGEIAASRYLTGTEFAADRTLGDSLDDDRVSVIREIAGGPRLYGYRSLSNDVVNYGIFTNRDVVNTVQGLCQDALESFVFEKIDGYGRILSRLEAVLTGVLAPIADSDGFYARVAADGDVIDPGYVVDVGPSVNTPVSLAQNRLQAVVGIRVAPVATLVMLTITKAPANAAL